MPPGNLSMDLLNGIMPVHFLTPRYTYVYAIGISVTAAISVIAVSASLTFKNMRHSSGTSFVISIIIFTLIRFPDLTHVYRFDLTPVSQKQIESQLNRTQGIPYWSEYPTNNSTVRS